MDTITKTQAYKGLASAILLSALTAIIKRRYFDRPFVDSEWCKDMCDLSGIVYPLYKRKAYEMAEENKATEIIPPMSMT